MEHTEQFDNVANAAAVAALGGAVQSTTTATATTLAAADPATGGVKRVNVNFAQEAYETLLKLAEAKGTTMSAILRDAIALEKWFTEEIRNGGRIYVKHGDEVREVLKF
jgi:predicted DNA-binding protein